MFSLGSAREGEGIKDLEGKKAQNRIPIRGEIINK